MLERGNENSTKMKQLSLWNPLDHLRLLWWILVTPQQLMIYRKAHSENVEHMCAWLASTLVYLPLFIPVLATTLGILPHTRAIYLPIPYLWVNLILILAWGLTGWCGVERKSSGGRLLIIVAVTMIVMVATAPLVTFPMIDGLEIDLIGVWILCTILFVTVSLGSDAISGPGSGISELGALIINVVIYSQLVETLDEKMNGLVSAVVFIIVLALIWGIVKKDIEKNRENGRPSWLASGVAVILALGYFFLVWFSFLGGWRVFV